jgi:hypothetical protein
VVVIRVWLSLTAECKYWVSALNSVLLYCFIVTDTPLLVGPLWSFILGLHPLHFDAVCSYK